MNVFDRFPRRSLMHGGPLDGGEAVLPIPASMPWPAFRCHKTAGPWQHYTLDADAPRTALATTYVYAGECSVDNHDGSSLPHEHACCCGRNGCDGSGPWPHDVP